MELPKVINYTLKGKCSSCQECCADILPLTMKEIKEIAKYISEYGIKAKTRAQMFPKYQIDMRCCFIDDLTKTCMIYPVRPDICKSFICNQSMIDIHHNKMKILSRPGVYNVSMHVTFLRDSMFIEYISGNPVLREILTDIQIEW